MNKDTIYVFGNGYWIWAVDYSILGHRPLGLYQEFHVGMGFSSHEVQELVDQYLHDLWNDNDD